MESTLSNSALGAAGSFRSSVGARRDPVLRGRPRSKVIPQLRWWSWRACLAACVLVLLSCGEGAPDPAAEAAARAAREHAVWSALLDEPDVGWFGFGDEPLAWMYVQSRSMNLAQATRPEHGEFVAHWIGLMRGHGLGDDTLDDFDRVAGEALAVVPVSFSSTFDVRTYDETWDVLRGTDDWTAFYERNPACGGLLQLSRVGFSADGRQALLQVHYSWESLGGESSVVLLELADGDWRLVAKEVLVVS